MNEAAVNPPKYSGQRQGAICVWHGLGLPGFCRLIAKRPSMHWSKCLRISSAMMMSAGNSVLNVIESALYSRAIERTELNESPVFIIGHWRSGTTLLHNTMALDPQYSYCNLYEVLFPRHFLLTEKSVSRFTAKFLPKTRPMDNMPVSWELPQEDETALLLMTLLSPYLMLAFQSDDTLYQPYFELAKLSPAELERWKKAFIFYLKKLTLKDSEKGAPKRMLLKSPTHTFRIPLLLELFPKAKFVFIARNPYAVFNSSMHLRRSVYRDNGLGLTELNGLEEMVLDVYENLFQVYQRDRQLIPEGQLCEVRFEDLEANLDGEIGRIYESLDLPGFDQLRPELEARLESHRKYRKNVFDYDPELQKRLAERWQPAFEYFGYDPGLDGDVTTRRPHSQSA